MEKTRQKMMKNLRIVALGTAVLLLGACGGAKPTTSALDHQAVEILKLVLAEQPDPAGPPTATYNYRWAELAMAWLAAERNGYMARDEALTRLRSILDFAERCERRGGFWYDGYDLATARATGRNVHFQGWWLYGLIVLRNAYPELREQCDRMLAQLDYTGERSDYTGEHMYNPETHRLAADIHPDGKVGFEWSLFGSPAGEGRSAYVAYAYVTGDISPFLFESEPEMQEVEGHRLLKIWMQQNFEFPFMHYEMHDVGYYEESFNQWKEATRKYLARTGMTMVPIRQSFLHTSWDDNGFPCTEHRESMSFITWALDPAAPVWEAAWIPGVGICRFLDNWNFYWSALGTLRPAGARLDAGRRISFPVRIRPSTAGSNPARLDEIRFPIVVTGRPAPLVIGWNDTPVARVLPASADGGEWTVEMLSGADGATGVVASEAPPRWYGRVEKFDETVAAPAGTRWVSIAGLRVEIAPGFNILQLRAEKDGGGAYQLLRYDRDVHPVRTSRPRGRGDHELATTTDSAPAMEIIARGQREGVENPFSFLARIMAVHGYRVCQELERDERYLESLVAWVGPYTNQARLARWVHNLGAEPVEVEYTLPDSWRGASLLISNLVTGEQIPVQVEGQTARWTQPGRATCHIARKG